MIGAYTSLYGDAHRNGVWRRTFPDAVTFQPSWLDAEDQNYEWDYAVFKYPFVPGFHVAYISYTADEANEVILSSHKTLHEAMAICKVLLANGGYREVD